MKYAKAMELIKKSKIKNPHGFMVSFEIKKGRMLTSDHFPDKHAGEDLIESENQAWDIAFEFSKVSIDYVNIYVIDECFDPVKGYKNKIMNKY